jgi:ornithine cyclodeaminase/alanine dehydrogenase-like protein (mu-crystallin family)
MRVVDEAEVARVLTPAAVRGLMRDVFLAEARGRTSNPVRSMAAAPKGWLGAMPAYVDTGDLRGLGAKIVAFFPGNAEFDEPTHRATIAMLDPDRGELLALVAGETITERRTAAVSVVATQRLAARPKGRHAILGAGLQGHAHLTAFADAGMVESLAVWSRNGAHAEALVAYARTLGIADARVSASPAEAVHEAGVVTTVTSTIDPILAAGDLPGAVHVNAVGACTPERRELASDVIARAAVFVDSRDAALRESGDVLVAMRELDRTDLIEAELGDMLADPDRSARTAATTVFKSLGLGIEDVICAAYVLRELAPPAA